MAIIDVDEQMENAIPTCSVGRSTNTLVLTVSHCQSLSTIGVDLPEVRPVRGSRVAALIEEYQGKL